MNAFKQGLAGTRESLRAELAETERLSAELEQYRSLERASSGAENGGIEDEVPVAIAAVARRAATPEQMLRAMQVLHPDRVIVLPSAFDSAVAARRFRHPRKLIDIVHDLVTAYPDLVEGNGDGAARKLFGNAYAAREAETLSRRGQSLRTFTYAGKSVFMQRHLKLGVNSSPTEALRLHFHWDSKRRRVVIGHCGAHLDFR